MKLIFIIVIAVVIAVGIISVCPVLFTSAVIVAAVSSQAADEASAREAKKEAKKEKKRKKENAMAEKARRKDETKRKKQEERAMSKARKSRPASMEKVLAFPKRFLGPLFVLVGETGVGCTGPDSSLVSLKAGPKASLCMDLSEVTDAKASAKAKQSGARVRVLGTLRGTTPIFVGREILRIVPPRAIVRNEVAPAKQ